MRAYTLKRVNAHRATILKGEFPVAQVFRDQKKKWHVFTLDYTWFREIELQDNADNAMNAYIAFDKGLEYRPPEKQYLNSMGKDRRYDVLAKLINTNNLNTFNEIFDIVPRSVVARDLGKNSADINKIAKDVQRLSVRHIFQLATFAQIDATGIFDLINNQYLENKERVDKIPGKE